MFAHIIKASWKHILSMLVFVEFICLLNVNSFKRKLSCYLRNCWQLARKKNTIKYFITKEIQDVQSVIMDNRSGRFLLQAICFYGYVLLNDQCLLRSMHFLHSTHIIIPWKWFKSIFPTFNMVISINHTSSILTLNKNIWHHYKIVA